ncbi:ABC transporter ATP-binding protein [Reinekea blandensis]|uniref:Glycerol-3-phosphate ABC transporter, ATP-binding protein n=1 Tax=Reinekea blandensis MED297 TaxID=314283 RepID=A4BHS2_9GAMM|nr:sn-glycerol-3-phosphate ABC transporter ATP-binding protein UgpC [Reinekea blandensis]EAR08327.1 glycerol-3-phosphate ABC transporter, ATP-binding protein [Reinekea sp. MED297] [Reinekea blandensis MED297]
MGAITLNNIEKTYPNGHHAIKGISLDIQPGEFLVLVGPSGCGKSTLLRTIAGLESVTEGEIHIGDRQVNSLAPAKRDIAMVFQNYALYPHMTVYKNMAYGLKNRGVDKAQIDQKVQDTAKLLHLQDYLDRKPGQLSGGQRQRVAMGRAIVRDPKAFLFDEPLSNLDAKLRVQMRNEIKSLQRTLKTTSVYVTHDQTEAMTLADRLAVVNAGVVEQIGSPIEIYERPESLFVASFIGSPAMNFMTGELANGQLILGGESFALQNAPEFTGSVTVGLRPEHLYRKNEHPFCLNFSINMLEPLGADTLVHGRLGEGSEEVTARLSRTYPADGPMILPLYFNEQELHFFDPATGQRIDG